MFNKKINTPFKWSMAAVLFLLALVGFKKAVAQDAVKNAADANNAVSDDNNSLEKAFEKDMIMCYEPAPADFGTKDVDKMQLLLTDYKNDGVINQDTYDKAKNNK